MKQNSIFPDFSTSLEAILKEGAQKLLQQAIENEVAKYLELHSIREPIIEKLCAEMDIFPKIDSIRYRFDPH